MFKNLATLAVVLSLASVALADPSKTIVENAAATPELSSLVSVLSLPAYRPILNALNRPGTYTVFAPNNAAFAQAGIDPSKVDLVTQVLFYHVLPVVVPSTALQALQFPHTLVTNQSYVNRGAGVGQVLGVSKDSRGVHINFLIPGVATYTANVVVADVRASNGIIHIVDRVILLPAATSAVATTGGLNSLLRAVVKAGLAAAVDNTAALTIFAPTDAAFAQVPWDSLPIETLRNVLLYHVVPKDAWSTELRNGQQLPTLLQGKTLSVNIDGQGVRINDAKVALPNIISKNAAIHLIDKVILPPGLLL